MKSSVVLTILGVMVENMCLGKHVFDIRYLIGLLLGMCTSAIWEILAVNYARGEKQKWKMKLCEHVIVKNSDNTFNT